MKLVPKVFDAAGAFRFLLANPHIPKVCSSVGHFRWGDANAICNFPGGISDVYQGLIVLVEIRGPRRQYQHWGFRFKGEEHPEIKPTWFINRVMLPVGALPNFHLTYRQKT